MAKNVNPMDKQSNTFQLVWGAALVLMGVALFFRIPQVIPQIKTIPQFAGSGIYFVYFCLYLLGVLLIFGGAKKLHQHYRRSSGEDTDKD